LAVAGNIMNLESYTQIEKFLREKGVEIINLSDEEVMDLGTIMFFTL
jgi:predicted GTPase